MQNSNPRAPISAMSICGSSAYRAGPIPSACLSKNSFVDLANYLTISNPSQRSVALLPFPLRSLDGQLKARCKPIWRKFLHHGLARFTAHLRREITVLKQADCMSAQFSGIIGKKSAYSMRNRRGRVPVAEHWQTCRHGLKRGHVETVLQLRVRRVDKETVTAQHLLQLHPVPRRLHTRHILIVADNSHRKVRKCFFMKIP